MLERTRKTAPLSIDVRREEMTMGILDIFRGRSRASGAASLRTSDSLTQSGGDGTSPDQAAVFSGGSHMECVAASYIFIGQRHGKQGFDWDFDSRDLIKHGNRMLDALTVRTRQGNRIYYFDVSQFFARRHTSAAQRTAGIYDFVTKEMRRLASDLRDRRSEREYVDLSPRQLFRLTVCWLAAAEWSHHPDAHAPPLHYDELVSALCAIAEQVPGQAKLTESDIRDLFVTARRLMFKGGPGEGPTSQLFSWNFAKLIFGDRGLDSDMSKMNPLVAQHHAHFFTLLAGEEIPIELLDDPV